jgi:hypothetical protein
MRKQHVAMPCRYRESALAIQIELRRTLKHLSPRAVSHQNPLFTTSTHYIEKTSLGQAGNWIFSLRDKQLARKVNAG